MGSTGSVGQLDVEMKTCGSVQNDSLGGNRKRGHSLQDIGL